MKWEELLSVKIQKEKEEEPDCWEKYPINVFEKDYQSIISSVAFRRLQDKTQVFPLDKSDFVRTRLTHSMEVSTIAKQLGIMITQNKGNYLPEEFKVQPEMAQNIPSVLSCAGLLHDLGNPPFGHFGEEIIRDWFKNNIENGKLEFMNKTINSFLDQRMLNDLYYFEGNAQALRILSKVKNNAQGFDPNLTYCVMSTLIKYPTDSEHMDSSKEADIKRHKLGYFYAEEGLFKEICEITGTYLEETHSYVRHPLTFLLEAADDIAYATSDLEDALKKDMFTVDEFVKYFTSEAEKINDIKKKEKTNELIQNLIDRLQNVERNAENDFIAFQRWMVYVRKWLMYVVAYSFSKNYSDIMSGEYDKDLFADGFHQYSLDILKGAMVKYVFDTSEILKLELAAKKILTALLNEFMNAVINWQVKGVKLTKTQKKIINLIPENYKTDYLNARGDDEAMNLYLRFLMVTDYISGMTDSYAKNLFQELNGIE